MIRISHSTRGGSFPSRDAAPAMKYDVHLPRGQRAGFERLNDPATMRLPVMDEGLLGATNFNEHVGLVDADAWWSLLPQYRHLGARLTL